MDKRINRLLFFWLPLLILYLYAFNIVLEIDIAKFIFNQLPLWGWLIVYFAFMFAIKFYLKSSKSAAISDGVTSKFFGANSDIVIVFFFSVVSFILVMMLVGSSMESAINFIN